MKRVEWAEEDSNLRCFFVADLQSAVFAAGPPAQDRRAVHSPNNGPRFNIFGSGAPTYIVLLCLWIAVNPDRTAVTQAQIQLSARTALVKTSNGFCSIIYSPLRFAFSILILYNSFEAGHAQQCIY